MMNNQKGFSLVELVIVIAILGIFGTAVFGLFTTGAHSYRDVGDDSDIQNEAQLTVNQIENLVVDTTNALTYSYTAGGTTTRVLSDNGIGEVDGKTLTVYDKDAIYIIDWNKADKKIYLQKNEIDDSGTVTATGDRVEMAKNVSDFSVSLEKAESKSKVYIKVDFKSSDGRKGYSASKQISLRNVLAINDTSDAYEPANVPATVSGVQIYYNGQNYTEGTVSYFRRENDSMVFSFSALVQGTNFPSQQINWSISGNSSTSTSISSGGQLTIGDDEDLSNTLTVKATSQADPNYYTWASVKIKSITGVNIEIDSAYRADEYHYDDVIKVKATITGDNLESSDKKFRWQANGANRLNTYAETSAVQEFKIKATVGHDFTIIASSMADDSYSDSLTYSITSPYGVTIDWDGAASDKLLRKGTTNKIKATVAPDDGQQGEIKWEIYNIKNTTTGEDVTSSLSSTTAKKDKISLTAYRGATTSIYCGEEVDWNSKFSVGVRAFITVNAQRIYSRVIYINMDDVFIRVWNGTESKDIRTASESGGCTVSARDNRQAAFSYELFGYYHSSGVVTARSDNDRSWMVSSFSCSDEQVNFKVGNLGVTNYYRPVFKFWFYIDSKPWGRVNCNITR